MPRTGRLLALLPAVVALALAATTATAAAGPRVTEFTKGLSAGAQPVGIAAGPDGNVWFTLPAKDRIGKITPSGVVTEYAAGITPGAQPTHITAGPDGKIWFTEVGINKVASMTMAGVVTEWPAPYVPRDITAGPDGRVWFTGSGNMITAITTNGVRTAYGYSMLQPTSYPSGITTGPDGAMWVMEPIIDMVARVDIGAGMTKEWSFSETKIPNHGIQNNPVNGPDGKLWFTLQSAMKIARLEPSTAVMIDAVDVGGSVMPADLTVGADGRLWFGTYGDRVAGYDPVGRTFLEAPGITPGARATAVAAGPDDNIWFVEEWGGRIGRVTLDLPGRPDPVTLAATGVGETGATLRASVDAKGVPTTVRFEWGETPTYGNQTADVALGGSGAVPVDAALTGLKPKTELHFRVVAEAGGKTIVGDDRTVTTGTVAPPPPPPTPPLPPVTPPVAPPVKPSAPQPPLVPATPFVPSTPAAEPTAPPALPASTPLPLPRATPAPAPAPAASAATPTCRITVRWTAPRGTKLKAVTVRAAGTTLRRPGSARSATLALSGPTTVKVTATTRTGRRLTATRRLTGCATPRPLTLKR